jgi:hypothetical protein
MPGWQMVWQVRCRRPSIIAQHSKQIPMPHNGPRAVPVTDCRGASTPAMAKAAAAMLPAGTSTARPFTRTITVSFMVSLSGKQHIYVHTWSRSDRRW